MRTASLAAGFVLAFSACIPLDEAPTTRKPPPDTVTFGGARPATLRVPAAYDHTTGTPLPLVLVLHGYGASGALQAAYFGLDRLAEEEGFFLLAPDGTPSDGGRFWNATDACCNFVGSDVDDVAYLSSLVEEVVAEYDVDPRRIFVIGHSNGGFMSHRLACERPDLFAGAFSLAGAQWSDQARCKPTSRISVVQAHGTNDATILFEGGAVGLGGYPSALETISDWTTLNGCTGTLSATGPSVDLDASVDGDETTQRTVGGCPTGIAVELWEMKGSGHIPSFNASFPAAAWGWMQAHPKTL